MHQCPKCKTTDLKAFNRNKANPDGSGLQIFCRTCHNPMVARAMAQARRAEAKEAAIEERERLEMLELYAERAAAKAAAQ